MNFLPIQDFPDYEVHEDGRIYSLCSETFVTPQMNRSRVLNVVITRDGEKYCRSIAVLVATAFIEPPDHRCNTVIHLDGDRGNVHASNLAWRPRPFAIAYHKQFDHQPYRYRLNEPLIIHETMEEFPDSWELAKAYGLLESAVFHSAANIFAGDWSYTVYPQDFHILIKRHIK